METISSFPILKVPATGEKIIQLRALLHNRFPTASSSTSHARLRTGLDPLDTALQEEAGGGLAAGTLTEIVVHAGQGGGALLLLALIEALAAHSTPRGWLALVDGRDTFDATALDPAALATILWVRCRRAEEALKATDLLLRDGNLPLVILDLAQTPASELHRIAGPTWFRLQRVAGESGAAGLVFSPAPLVTSAQTRLALRLAPPLSIESLNDSSGQLLHSLTLETVRRRQRKAMND